MCLQSEAAGLERVREALNALAGTLSPRAVPARAVMSLCVSAGFSRAWLYAVEDGVLAVDPAAPRLDVTGLVLAASYGRDAEAGLPAPPNPHGAPAVGVVHVGQRIGGVLVADHGPDGRATCEIDREVLRSFAAGLAHVVTLSLIAAQHESPRTRMRALTPREREVFALIAQGERNAAIAERLVITHTTVKDHLSSIMTKLAAQNRAEAVARYFQARGHDALLQSD